MSFKVFSCFDVFHPQAYVLPWSDYGPIGKLGYFPRMFYP